MPEYAISGNNFDSDILDFTYDNNTLEALNYQIEGGFTIYDLLLGVNTEIGDRGRFFSKILYNLLVETDNLKYP